MNKLKRIMAILMTAAVFSSVSTLTASATVSKNNLHSQISVTKYNIYAYTGNKNYFISPKCATSSVLDIVNNASWSGANCQLYRLNYSYAQQYKLIRVGTDAYGAYFEICKATASNMVLDVSGGVARNGQNIQLYRRNGTRAQQWYIKDAGNGYYYIVSRLNTNYVMDVSGAGKTNGTNIHLYKKNYTSAQMFSFNTCNHSHTRRFSTLVNDWTDMIWVAGWECSDCHAVLTHGTWTLPN